MELNNTIYHIQRSKILFYLLVIVYGGAGGCVLLLPIQLWQQILLLGFCACVFYYQYWRRFFLYGKNAFINLTYVGDGKWSLCDRDNHTITALLQKSSVIWLYLVILHFREEVSRRFYAVLIFGDAMPYQELRRLKVCVRTSK